MGKLDNFAEAINDATERATSRELPPMFAEIPDPAAPKKSKHDLKNYTIRYARFVLEDERGNPDLERLFNDHLQGNVIICSEDKTFTKEGDWVVGIKWMVPK